MQYDDAIQPLTDTVHDYDPRLYGFPEGTLWPMTAEDAQAGRHRLPSLEQQNAALDRAFNSLEM